MFARPAIATATHSKRSFTPARVGSLQRKCACGGTPGPTGECEACRKKRESKTLERAAAEPARPLNEPVHGKLKKAFGHDFSRIKVHSGPASDEAAQSIGARAYTIGNDIHLGAEAHSLAGGEFNRLLVHEAVHTFQQGGQPASPHAGLTVSDPTDAAEQEAQRIADSVTSHDALQNPSRPFALRDASRVNSGQQSIVRMVAPQLQRDLTGKKAVKDGDFDLDLKTQSNPGAKSGLKGTIKFTASDKAPDSTSIRLLQIARLEDLTTGKDYVWTGGEANRNKVMTATSKDVDPGYFVDVLHAGRSPRAKKTDAAVSPYYITDYGTGGGNQDGSKKGETVKEASLSDYPGWNSKSRFSFETAAKGADTGYVYATLTWGFTISDGAKGTVDKEHATANRGPSATFGAAVKAFSEFYKNPGSSTAP